MRRLWVCLFVCLLAVPAAGQSLRADQVPPFTGVAPKLSAQPFLQPRLSFAQKRFGRIVATVSSPSDTLQQSDFTPAGGFRFLETVSTSWGDALQASYGDGFGLMRESGDSGNLHYVSFGYGSNYNSMTCALCNKYTLYQYRVPTLTTPASPLTYSNWNTSVSTGGKTYPGPATLAGGEARYGARRLVLYMGSQVPSEIGIDNTGKIGLGVDGVTSHRIWHTWGFGYGADCSDYSVAYIDLNYGTPANSTAAGPWSFTGIGSKAHTAWVSRLPASWAAAHTPGKEIVAGGGVMTSQAASCDVSIGASATAFAEPTMGATEQVSLANTPLVGYWPVSSTPGAGKGRMTRTTSVSFGSQPTFYSDPAWGGLKQTQFDYTEGCIIVDTGTKTGLVCISQRGEGECNYVNGTLPCQYFRDYISVYALDDLTPASGTARYDVQPVAQWEVQWPFADYTKQPYAKIKSADITSITASTHTVTYTLGVCTGLPVVTTATPHGLSVGEYASIEGTNQDTEFGTTWNVCGVPSSTTFSIGNTSDPSTMFTNVSATGGATYVAGGPRGNITGPRGVGYDPTTKTIMFMVSVYQAASGQGRAAFAYGFTLP